MSKEIAIYGASGFGREIAWLIESCAERDSEIRAVCFIKGTEKSPLAIGDDAVIGARAVVTKSVPPGETWGVPARNLHRRS